MIMITREVDELPMCDICVGHLLGKECPENDEKESGIRYDAPTKYGPWANLCPRHYDSIGLGTIACKFVLKKKLPPQKPAAGGAIL